MNVLNVLIIEDEMLIALFIQDILRQHGYSVSIATSTDNAFEQLALSIPDVILMDIVIGRDTDGVELAARINRQFDIPIIYLTSHADEETFKRAMGINPYGYMLKPVNERELISNILTASQRHQLEIKLKESETRYRMLIELAADAIFTVSIDNIILSANSRCETLTGYTREELISSSITMLFSAAELKRCPLQNYRIKNRETVINERIITRKDGQLVSVEMNSVMLPNETIQSICRDISERKKMEEAEQRAHKLESIGLLAGGIAHDFNNILTIIMGNISLAKLMQQQSPHEGRDETCTLLNEAEKASLRAKELTQQLLTFSRGGAPVKQNAYIDDIIRDSAEFILHGTAISSQYTFEENYWPAKIDKGQISQVIQNLVLNAVQSMPSGGEIHLSLQNDTIAERNSLSLAAGKYVLIKISDHGTGIAPEHIQNIFDPYFTTKQSGSGLGLAISYSIIKRHSGIITVSSILGEGTIFSVYIPASDEPVAEAEKPEAMPPKTMSAKKILFMDDETALHSLAANILRSTGHEVVTSSTGDEALSDYKDALQKGERFALVIMDLTVPGAMGGKELMTELKKVDPAARGIVSSGYSNDAVLSNYRAYGFCGMIEKPFDASHFLQTVNEVLQME